MGLFQPMIYLVPWGLFTRKQNEGRGVCERMSCFVFLFLALLLVKMFVRHAYGPNIRRKISKKDKKLDLSSELSGRDREALSSKGALLPERTQSLGSVQWQEELARPSLCLGSSSLEGTPEVFLSRDTMPLVPSDPRCQQRSVLVEWILFSGPSGSQPT